MNGLLVLTEPPLPFGGAASRWNYVLTTELLRRGAELTILCCSAGADRDRRAAEPFGNAAKMHFFEPQRRRGPQRLMSRLRPVSHLFSDQMRRTLYSFDHDRFDLVQFETHFAGWLADRPIDNAVMNVHSLYAIDHQDSDGVGGKLATKNLMRAERKVLRRFRRLSALTPRLARRVRQLVPHADVAVCPMSVDLSLYDFRDEVADPRRPFRVGMIGSFHWAPTRSAGRALVKRIWPRVAHRFDDARLVLVGRQADDFFGRRQGGIDVADDHRIEIHSDVADTVPFFHQLDAMIYLPNVGSGMKVKVMESIALGTPVVTNEEGCEGLPESIANVIRVRSDDAAVDRVQWLLRNRSEAREESRRLRSVLADELSPRVCVDQTLAFASTECRS